MASCYFQETAGKSAYERIIGLKDSQRCGHIAKVSGRTDKIAILGALHYAPCISPGPDAGSCAVERGRKVEIVVAPGPGLKFPTLISWKATSISPSWLLCLDGASCSSEVQSKSPMWLFPFALCDCYTLGFNLKKTAITGPGKVPLHFQFDLVSSLPDLSTKTEHAYCDLGISLHPEADELNHIRDTIRKLQADLIRKCRDESILPALVRKQNEVDHFISQCIDMDCLQHLREGIATIFENPHPRFSDYVSIELKG